MHVLCTLTLLQGSHGGSGSDAHLSHPPHIAAHHIHEWSDPKINFVFVLHKRLFVFVHAIRLCAVPELNFVRWRKRGS